ncbi:MAG: hypothetical protein KBT32_04705 [Bacteroidales bacterium]|nr:hypothetical protein [Candidatus Physcocola equi]
MQTLSFTIDVPQNNGLDMADLTTKVKNFVIQLVSVTPKMNVEIKTSKAVLKPLAQLDPAIQSLCGICHVEEADINGEKAREEALKMI